MNTHIDAALYIYFSSMNTFASEVLIIVNYIWIIAELQEADY